MIQSQEDKHTKKQEKQLPEDKQNNQQEQGEDEDNSNESGEQQHQKWKKIEKPQKCINLFMIDFNQCDGKKCTGRKMERFGMLKAIKDKERKKKFKGVVLSAFGDKMVSMQDLDLCLKYGICVIDCSWNRIEQTNQFRFKNQRILPYVVAGNPVNYGKPFQLSCVQALATALCAINYIPQAEYIMSKFGWADGFWSINQSIKRYADCKTLEELEKISQENQQAENTMKQRSYDLSSSSNSSNNSDQEEEEEENGNENQNENKNEEENKNI